MQKKDLLLLFFLIGAVSMLLMSMHYFTVENSGILGGKALKDSLWYKASFLTHITMGIIAISLGPFQFFDKLLRHRAIHRTLGYFYVTAVFLSGITGLVIAQFAMGGISTRVGFSLLSLVWLYSLMIALTKIKKGQIEEHKMWMWINYAVTFSAITQRTVLLFAFIPSVSFLLVYQISAWLPWLFNILLVSLFYKRPKNVLS